VHVRKLSWRLGIFLGVFAVAALVSPASFQTGEILASAEAKGPPRALRGQIITSKKRMPSTAKSERAYYKKVRKAKFTRFQEDKAKGQWKVYFAAFFRTPLNDLEITVKMYDITSGKRHLVNSFEQYTEGRGQTTMTSYVKLDRKFFGVNKKILMVMESRKKVLAQGSFYILGEGETFSGKVDFTQ